MDRFYSLSYLWYSATAMIVVVGVGMAVSAITGKPYVNAFPYNKADKVRIKNFLFLNKGVVREFAKSRNTVYFFLN